MIHAEDQIMVLVSQRMVVLISAHGQGVAMQTLVITAPILPVILSICGLNSFVRDIYAFYTLEHAQEFSAKIL